jgi:uncharacterized tellurite resistance protein B-like protein
VPHETAAAFASGASPRESPDAFPRAPSPSAEAVQPGGSESLEIHATPDDVVNAIGQLDQNGLDQAAALIGGLPVALRDAAHDPFAGRALIYGLVLDAPPSQREQQIEHLQRHAERGVPQELVRMLPLIEALDDQHKLTLIEMAIPALKELSGAQYRTFIDNLVTLIKADQRIDLMEWVLHRLLVKELRPHFEGRQRLPVRHGRLHAVAGEATVLLSALAREGGRAPEQVASAFAAGLEALGLEGQLDRADDPSYLRLNRALAELRGLKPLQKPRLIKACAATVLADGHVSAREGALLQGIAAALDCPLPPSIYIP